MLEANTKYTAKEILEEAGFKPAEVLGKVRVRIGGIRGIVKPEHIVKIQPGTEKLNVVVGVESKDLEVQPDKGEITLTEAVHLVKEAEAKELAKKVEEPKTDQ